MLLNRTFIKKFLAFFKQKTIHAACGYLFKVERSDGVALDTKYFKEGNSVDEFLKAIFHAEEKIMKKSETDMALLMQQKDWTDFKSATHCHI